MKELKDCKIGDSVFSVRKGKGAITGIADSMIEVMFDDDTLCATVYYGSGKSWKGDKYPELFAERPEWFPKKTEVIKFYPVLYAKIDPSCADYELKLSDNYYSDLDEFEGDYGIFEYAKLVVNDFDYLEKNVEIDD